MTQEPDEMQGGANLPAKVYEPTLAEQKALDALQKRRQAKQPVPRMKVTVEDIATGTGKTSRKIEIAPGHADLATGYELLSAALADDSRDFLNGLLLDGISRAVTTSRHDNPAAAEQALNFGVAFVAGMKPRDHVEAMLATQMLAVHLASMSFADKMALATKPEALGAYSKSFNALTRTFAAQADTLKRYRSKGEQRVIVERVNVEKGGQAIVGTIERKADGGGDDD